MNKVAIVRLITGPHNNWEGAMNVRVLNGEKASLRIGTIAIPGTEFHSKHAMSALLAAHSTDYLQRNDYFDSVVLLPTGKIEKDNYQVLLGNSDKDLPLIGEDFWSQIGKGLPAKLDPKVAKGILEYVNDFQEVRAEGVQYQISTEGKVVKTQLVTSTETRE